MAAGKYGNWEISKEWLKRGPKKSGMVKKIFKLDIERCCEVSQCNGVLFDLKDSAQGQLPGGG